MDKNIGKKLDGRYEITELIGVGGMAEVYKGVDVIDNKTVAIKILKKEFAENEEFLRRFRNESKAIAVLSHPSFSPAPFWRSPRSHHPQRSASRDQTQTDADTA